MVMKLILRVSCIFFFFSFYFQYSYSLKKKKKVFCQHLTLLPIKTSRVDKPSAKGAHVDRVILKRTDGGQMWPKNICLSFARVCVLPTLHHNVFDRNGRRAAEFRKRSLYIRCGNVSQSKTTIYCCSEKWSCQGTFLRLHRVFLWFLHQLQTLR